MDLSGSFGALISASIVAGVGTAWFAHVMTNLKTARPLVRRGVYAGVFAAYFLLTLILIEQLGG